jgi:hypothetical protein
MDIEDDSLFDYCSACRVKVHSKPLVCGHVICDVCFEMTEDDDEFGCPVCLYSKQCIVYDPLDWLDNETISHEYLVLVLCTGKWVEFYDLYLETLIEIIPAIRIRGGEIFCLATEGPKEDVIGNVKLRIYRDREQIIPKMFSLIGNELNGAMLPAVVILGKDKEKVLFKWDPSTEGNTTILPRNLLHITKFVNKK